MSRDLKLNILEPARTCVWMDAGAVAFRLCDRGFACEHCPFDAAMRRDPRASVREDEFGPPPGEASWDFPGDRLYSEGHLWVQVVRDRRVRVGVDALAARVLAPIRAAPSPSAPASFERGELLCTLVCAGGNLPLSAPVSGTFCGFNELLLHDSAAMLAEPYTAGWLAEVWLDRPAELDGLQRAAEARARAELDARRFRRLVAFHVLSTDQPPAAATGAPALDASLRLIGSDPFVGLARQVLLDAAPSKLTTPR